MAVTGQLLSAAEYVGLLAAGRPERAAAETSSPLPALLWGLKVNCSQKKKEKENQSQSQLRPSFPFLLFIIRKNNHVRHLSARRGGGGRRGRGGWGGGGKYRKGIKCSFAYWISVRAALL